MCYPELSNLLHYSHARPKRKTSTGRPRKNSRLAFQIQARDGHNLSDLQQFNVVYQRPPSATNYVGARLWRPIRWDWLSADHGQLRALWIYHIHKRRDRRNSTAGSHARSSDARQSAKKLNHKWQKRPSPTHQPICRAAQLSQPPMRSGK